jgi:hypothetical protein
MLSIRHLLYRVVATALGTATLAHAHAAETGGRTAIYLPAERAPANTAAITQALEEEGFRTVVIARNGESTTDYAHRVRDAVRDLGWQGVAPEDISVIGAGVGSQTAILASSLIANSGVSYVLLGQCDRHLQDTYRLRPSGRLLGIHDASDTASHSCRPLWSGAPLVGASREIVTSTGLGAALFDQPREQWMRPAVAWMSHEHVDVGALRVGMVDSR